MNQNPADPRNHPTEAAPAPIPTNGAGPKNGASPPAESEPDLRRTTTHAGSPDPASPETVAVTGIGRRPGGDSAGKPGSGSGSGGSGSGWGKSGAPSTTPLPMRIGPYKPLAHLGTGGMGEVFLVLDEVLGRRVALKRVRPDRIGADRSGCDELRRRFEVEARITARLQHPAVIPVYQFVNDEEGAYYTMRPVEGMTLADLVRDLREDVGTMRRQWPTPRIVRVLLQATNAIAYAHSREVVHRDLKPSNIMIGAFEEVLVLDWGMAKVVGEEHADDPEGVNPKQLEEWNYDALNAETASQLLVGTPAYMAPEQFEGAVADFRSEVFSLAVTLYEALAFRPPWEEALPKRLKAMQTPPPDPAALRPRRNIPTQLTDVVLKALRFDPDLRYQTVKEFAHDLTRAAEGVARRQLHRGSGAPDKWRIADGRVLESERGLKLRSRGNRGIFRYFCVDRFPDNARLEFELYLPRGTTELAVHLNTTIDRDGDIADGYSLDVVAGRRRLLSLLRSGRDVAGTAAPNYEVGKWIHISAGREEGRISLHVDGDERYGYHDPIPLSGGYLGIVGRSNGVRIRNLEVTSRGSNVTTSCLSVPDAFYNRGLYDEARAEYEGVYASHPGRREGDIAYFRAGLCEVELSRREGDAAGRAARLRDATRHFEDAGTAQSSLVSLGRAIVAEERNDRRGTHQALASALDTFRDDPHRETIHEWLLGRLHSLASDERAIAAEFMPLAIEHCMDRWGRRVVRDCIQSIRGRWETPSFSSARGRFREHDPVSHAESKMFFAFWANHPELVHTAGQELLHLSRLRPFHIADTAFSLLELDALETAEAFLEESRAEIADKGGRFGAVQVACESAVWAMRGELDQAAVKFGALAADATNRVNNAARLWLARAAWRNDAPAIVERALQRHTPGDTFAREHLAWFALLAGDPERAAREMEPLVERGDHREGRNLSNVLVGCTEAALGRPDEAYAIFELLPQERWPRTWTLGSYLATSRLGPSDESYDDLAFYWELENLRRHRRLVEACGLEIPEKFNTRSHVGRPATP